MKTTDKLISRKDLETLSDLRSGQTLVFTNGCFDLIHPGHIHLLTSAKKMGDLLLIGLNSDESVSRLKGPSRPVTPQEKRIENLARIEAVDFIVVFEEDTPRELIQEVRPDVLVKGSDYQESEIVGSDFVKSYGGQVRRIPLLEGHSTTKLIEKNKKK